MAFRREYLEAIGLLAQAFERVVERGCERPVIVGGAAVEWYTGSAVTSGDFDIVTGAQDEVEAALLEVGFTRRSGRGQLLRGLIHPKLLMGVEVVGGHLFDGKADRAKVVLVDVSDETKVSIAPIEDMIADRMGQFAAKQTEMLDQAIKMYELAGEIDENYLEARIREETLGEYGLKDLARLSRESG